MKMRKFRYLVTLIANILFIFPTLFVLAQLLIEASSLSEYDVLEAMLMGSIYFVFWIIQFIAFVPEIFMIISYSKKKNQSIIGIILVGIGSVVSAAVAMFSLMYLSYTRHSEAMQAIPIPICIFVLIVNVIYLVRVIKNKIKNKA